MMGLEQAELIPTLIAVGMIALVMLLLLTMGVFFVAMGQVGDNVAKIKATARFPSGVNDERY